MHVDRITICNKGKRKREANLMLERKRNRDRKKAKFNDRFTVIKRSLQLLRACGLKAMIPRLSRHVSSDLSFSHVVYNASLTVSTSRADLHHVVSSTGVLLLPFLLGSVATTIGTVVAYLLVPMRSLGPDSWKIAVALMGRHIGGAVNYVAISDALGVQPSVLAVGLAADNVICALYFSALFALASKVPPEPSASVDDDAMNLSGSGDKLPVLQMATSLAVSFSICKAATILTGYFGIQGGTLPLVTAIAVISATVFPKPFASLASSGEPMAVILIQFTKILPNSVSIRTCTKIVIESYW
ncbi:hypothetical protein RYX36_023040 [Vicia faba]